MRSTESWTSWPLDAKLALLAKLRAEKWRRAARPEQLPPSGDWRYFYLQGGRGSGKLLAAETRIPTPSGWTTMRDLAVGDIVFDEQGCPTRVAWKSEERVEEAYRLRFSDGAELISCEDHEWTTWDHPARKAYMRSSYEDAGRLPVNWPNWRPLKRPPHFAARLLANPTPSRDLGGAGPRVRTTKELLASLRQGKRGDLNHSIPVAGALELPDVQLPVSPYVLGYWLGDGSSSSAEFTIGDQDASEAVALLEAEGEAAKTSGRHCRWTFGKKMPARDPVTGRMVANDSLHSRLRGLGVLGNKHVPATYLRASKAQRLALLQGLMDSDGYAAGSSVEFTSTRKRLALDVLELARSLGQKPRMGIGRATLEGRDCGPKFRVSWRPTAVVFRLRRKAAAVRPLGAQAFRSLNRMVTSIERTGVGVPMFCIGVESPNRSYLAGEAMIPTHNSRAGAENLADWILTEYDDGHGPLEWAVVAPTFKDARDVCVEADGGLLDALSGAVEKYNRSTGEIAVANGAKVFLDGADDGGLRIQGHNLRGAWCDEIGLWARGGGERTWDESLAFALRFAPARVVVTGTPKAGNVLVKRLRADPSTAVSLMKTMDNAANLHPAALAELLRRFQGTRLGRQELEAELLEDVEGALWTLAQIEAMRVSEDGVPGFSRVVVAIDPNVSSSQAANDAGIIVAGRGPAPADASRREEHGYVLADRTCTSGGPRAWAREAVKAYHEFEADRIVAEKNQGGELVELTLKTVDPSVPVKLVSATKGKRTRAEPVASLYEGDEDGGFPPRIHHVGAFPELEDEMCTWVPDPSSESPNRMDALVWAFTELMLSGGGARIVSAASPAAARIPGVTERASVVDYAAR